MKTIKVFLASSEELKDEREKFGNLIRRLDDIYIKRDIHVQLLMWEDMDPCYNNVRKQNEYNEWIRESQIFVALFYTHAGIYTLEELQVAREENARRKEPKLMIYCQNLQPGEVEEAELVEFKRTLNDELGHFWGTYGTTDKLHLDFVMFFMRSAERKGNVLKVENGQIVLDDYPVASMDHLPFAAGNEGYQRMKSELESLPMKIERAVQRVEKYPDDEDFRDDLQSLLDRQNALRVDFSKHQHALFDTALRISEIQQEKISHELQRAISAFEAGHVEAANVILESIEHEAEGHMEQLDRDRSLVHQDIEALLLKTKTLMADVTKDIEERIQQTWATYRKADGWAERAALPREKYIKLLSEYGEYLFIYAKYDEALELLNRACQMCLDLYGEEHYETGNVYLILSSIYSEMGEREKALAYCIKAKNIAEKVLSPDHLDLAMAYNNLGALYFDRSENDLAMAYTQKALAIREKQQGEEHNEVAMSYNNLGSIHAQRGEFQQALECYNKALDIRKKIQGENSLDVAMVYNNLANIYASYLNDDEQALLYLKKVLEIREKQLGPEHPETARTLGNIGTTLQKRGEYNSALECYLKNKEICEKVLGVRSPSTATCYNNLGVLYAHLEDYERALEYLRKSLETCEQVYEHEPDHPDIAQAYNNLGKVLAEKGEITQALECFMKALEIYRKKYGEGHEDTVMAELNITRLLENIKDGHTRPGSSGCMLILVPVLVALSVAVRALISI